MRLVALLLVLGCGSSSKSPETPVVSAETAEEAAKREARAAREKRRQEIDATKPEDPYELRDKQAFTTKDRCGQGPYRIETQALAARYGERMRLYACGKAIAGSYRMTATRTLGPPHTFERAFGDRADNEACKGQPVAIGSASTTAASGAGNGNGEASAATSGAPAQLESRVLATSAVPPRCKETSIMHAYTWSTSAGIALEGKVTFDVWSAEPNDLTGLVFVVERSAVRTGMTPERWTQYRAAYDAWYDVSKAFSDEQIARGDWTIVDNTVTTPAPPKPRSETPPPKPSANARWIPGYWHHAEGSFHWIAGLWDVPAEDVAKELTVHAPTPPPVRAPVDVRVPRPTATAVWTPGSWSWDGHVYVWIAGAWRIPPGAQHTWQQPTWRVRGPRAIYVPGGWRIRIGR